MDWEHEFILYIEKNLKPSVINSEEKFKIEIRRKNFNSESELPVENLESTDLEELVDKFVDGGYRVGKNDLLRTINSLPFITSQNVFHFSNGEFDYANSGKDKKLYSPIEKNELEKFYKLYVMKVNDIEEAEED